MRIKNVVPHVASLAMLILVYGLGVATNGATADQPTDAVTVQLDCPHEDSCTVDYDGRTDRWTVRRDR